MEDHWIPSIHLLGDLARTDLDELPLDQNVAYFATKSGELDWNKIGQFLPSDCFDLIMPIKAPTSSAGLERVAWFPTILGVFTQKSTYNSLVERYVSSQARIYKEIWRIKAFQWLKTFLWVAVNDALLTNHAWLGRGLATYDTCPICEGALEAMFYVLWDCEVAKKSMEEHWTKSHQRQLLLAESVQMAGRKYFL